MSLGSQLSSKERSLKRGIAHINDLVSRRSNASIEARSISVSPTNHKRNINFNSTPQIVSAKGNTLLKASFKTKTQLRPELQLAVM